MRKRNIKYFLGFLRFYGNVMAEEMMETVEIGEKTGKEISWTEGKKEKRTFLLLFLP